MKEPRFVKLGADGNDLPDDATDHVAVLDALTGRIWAREPIPVENWKPDTEARVAGELVGSRLAGLEGWRIPTVHEIFLLTDLTRRSPAIDPEYFPDTPSDWFWTSTPYAPSPGGCAWYVGFGYGSAYWGSRNNDGFVRAVRAGQ